MGRGCSAADQKNGAFTHCCFPKAIPRAAQQPANHCCTSNAGTAVLPCYQHHIRLELIDRWFILYKTSVNHLKKNGSRGVEDKLWAPKCGQWALTGIHPITLGHVRIAKCPTLAQRNLTPYQKAEDIPYRTIASVWKQWFAMMANICQGSGISTSLQKKVQFKKDLGFRNCQSLLHGVKGFNFLHRMFCSGNYNS